MAKRPFHSSAAGVRPVSKAGTRPAGSSSGSPGSRRSVSWKGSGQKAAQSDNQEVDVRDQNARALVRDRDAAALAAEMMASVPPLLEVQ